jgi:N-methylhydantoinase A
MSRLAIDIGGTFTDVVFGADDGTVTTRKVSTTVADITVGIFEGIRKVDVDLQGVETFVHGTTIALNAMLEGKLPRTGLITTKGFRDVLEIMRTNRPNMYDLQQEKPVPIVPRRYRREISARMDYTGQVISAVEPDEVLEIARFFKSEGVQAIAVCLLHSYNNAEHELEIAEILRGELPTVTISPSSDVSRMWREFERTSTVVANAACKPIVAKYLDTLGRKLDAEKFSGAVLIMQSNGGVMSVADAAGRPVSTLMSGPIGGVTGALEVARRLGPSTNLVTLDIGGTSADVAIIDGGEAVTRTVGQVASWPVQVPMVDIESIGAGGGSIARVDELGALTVGPASAGADPGPACYGRGGTDATVTDANLVLGRIDPSYFLGGDLDLDIEAARATVQADVADQYDMGLERAAEGVIAIVNSNMTRLLWEVMLGRGYDPRDFALLAFGGAGPLHACELAQSLGMREVIVPLEPGTFSAVGILGADMRQDAERMLVGAATFDGPALRQAYADLEQEAHSRLSSEKIEAAEVEYLHTAELRYFGQDHVIAVDLDRETEQDLLELAVGRFHEKHERLYGFRRRDVPVEAIRIQVSAVGRLQAPDGAFERQDDGGSGAGDRRRDVYCGQEWHVAAVFERSAIPRGETLIGPCVIEEPGSTTWVPPKFEAQIDESGMIRIAVPQEGSL